MASVPLEFDRWTNADSPEEHPCPDTPPFSLTTSAINSSVSILVISHRIGCIQHVALGRRPRTFAKIIIRQDSPAAADNGVYILLRVDGTQDAWTA